MYSQDIALFALNASRDFGEQVAAALGIALSAHEEREFDDGEHKSRPLINVRGKDVFVIQSLYADRQRSVNDKLMRLLFFVGALNDASAQRVTVVVPYLCYARKDRKSQSRDPVTNRYVAALFEAVGTDRILTLDVHNLAAYQNAYRCRTDHLDAKMLFAHHFAPLLRDADVTVVSPDVGGIKRAEQFRVALNRLLGKMPATAFLEKYRSQGVITGDAIIGDIHGRVAIIIDDIINTGSTMARAVKACHAQGAIAIYATASHGVFTDGANRELADASLTKVVITNTVPPFRLESTVGDKILILNAAPLFAQAIKCIHTGESIVELLES